MTMKSKLTLLTATALAVASSVLLGVAATNETYTVNAGGMVFTNAIAVSTCVGDGKKPTHCTLIRYVGQYGIGTNDFHAWMVPVTVTTNRVRK